MKDSTALRLNRIFPAVLISALFFVNDSAAQSGNKYATGLNSLTATDGLGSYNYEGLNFYTNAVKRGAFTKDGEFEALYKAHFYADLKCDSIIKSWKVQTDNLRVFGNAVIDSTLHAQRLEADALSIAGNANITDTLNIGLLTLTGNRISSSTGTISFSGNNLVKAGTLIATTVDAQTYLLSGTAIDFNALDSTDKALQVQIDSIETTVANITSSQWQNTGTNSISYTGNATVNGTFQANNINTALLTISDKFTAPKGEFDTLRAERQLSINHNLKLGRDSGSTAESDIASKIDVLKIQSDPNVSFDVVMAEGNEAKIGIGVKEGLTAKLNVLGGTRLNGDLQVTGNSIFNGNIISQGAIDANTINASNINLNGTPFSGQFLRLSGDTMKGNITFDNNTSLNHSSSNGLLRFNNPQGENIIGLGYNLDDPATQQGFLIAPSGYKGNPNGSFAFGDANPNGQIILALGTGQSGTRINLDGAGKRLILQNDGGDKFSMGGVNALTLLETTQGINIAPRSGFTFSGTHLLDIQGSVNAQQYYINGNPIDVAGIDSTLDTLQSIVNNFQSSQWQNTGDGMITYDGSAVINGSLQAGSITTANLTIIDKIESDSMHARKSIEINNSLRLLRDTSVMYAEMSTKDTAVALMLQKDAAAPVVIGDAPAPPPGGSRDKLTVLGNTKLDGHLSVMRDITSAGSINANCVTTSCLNVSGQTSFDSIKVTNKLQVGTNSVIIESINDGGLPDNNIYSDNGDLLIQNQNSLNYNTILNSNNTGNVGIGTTQPTEKLDISGNIRSSALAGTGSRLVTADASGVLTTQSITGSNNPYWSATGNSGTGADNFIGTTDESDLVIKTNNEERIRVTSAGEHPGLVGVGTNNPEKMLHIKTEHSFLEPPNPNCAGPFPPLECAQQSDGGGNSGSHNGIRLEDITSFTGGTTYNSKWDLVPAYGGLIFGRGDASGSDYDALIGTQPKVMIDQNGNVGIGATPAKTLDVKGQGIRLENQVNSDLSVWDLEPVIDNSFNGVANSLLNKLTIGKPTHPLMTFSSGDNGGLAAYAEGFGITLPLTDFIGIGTTNPLAKLDIYSDKDYGADASIRISNQHSVPAEDSPFNFGAGFNISLMYNYQNQLNGATIDNGDGGNLQITSKTNGMFIENSNNIWRTSFNTDLTIGSQYSNKSLNVIGNADISGNLKIKVSSADDIALAIYKEDTEQFRITGNGVFYARGYKIKLGDFPDYVFKANYKPMTLAEKLDYIKKHGHLPYLPPANEIEKNGLDIGEGIVGITRNVEEIILSQNDLYKIIQAQQEQISLQQQQIDDLKKKLK